MAFETDKETLTRLYHKMYQSMIAKDINASRSMMDENSHLIHMTGMRQSREEYLHYIANGTLNYFDYRDTEIELDVQGDTAHMIAKSHVDATVFGGGRHTWPLRLDIDWQNNGSGWKILEIRAFTF